MSSSPHCPSSLSLHSASSPLRGSGKKTKGDHTFPPSAQADLQQDLSKEIRDHTWMFDAERIANMLSTDGKGPADSILNSAQRTLNEKQAPHWPTSGEERTWYPPLATFLNNCVDACHSALRGSTSAAAKDPRFYDRLKFIVYDKNTEDGVDGAAPVKPDLVGGLDLKPDERVAWSPRDAHVKQVLLPVEVKGDWAPMVSRAATYARCLFSARPSRQFALVLGFQHGEGKGKLRFLVFHRSGMTGSKSLSVKDGSDQKDTLRILLSILDWRHAKDAGFPDFFNDFEMFLFRHEGDQDGVVATVTEVLHDGLCVRGRASRVLLMRYPTCKGKEPESFIPPLAPTVRTRRHRRTKSPTAKGDEGIQPHVIPIHNSSRGCVTRPSPLTEHWSSPLVTDTTNGDRAHVVVKLLWCEDKRQEVEAELLTACKDDFGTPDHHYSFRPTDTRKAPMSTARFLPTDGEQPKDFHWAVIPGSKVPSHPQRRSLWIHVSKLVGRSLVHAKTPWELYLAIGHAMLGWLAMLRKGFLHRDVSIGNTLMLDPPVTMKPFEVWTIEELMSTLTLQYEGELAKYAKLLEDAIEKMGRSDECHGFIIDGDMAAKLKGYFTSRGTGDASGTYEFMSTKLVETLEYPEPHLHSPVDDLESFYYMTQWAVAFNDGMNGKRHDGIKIQRFREMIAGDRREQAVIKVRQDISPRTAEADYGLFFARSLPLLAPWREKLVTLSRGWVDVMDEAAELNEMDREENMGLNFLIYGYRGVAEYLELVHQLCASLQV